MVIRCERSNGGQLCPRNIPSATQSQKVGSLKTTFWQALSGVLRVARQTVSTQLPSQSRALVATATDFNTTENANTANKS